MQSYLSPRWACPEPSLSKGGAAHVRTGTRKCIYIPVGEHMEREVSSPYTTAVVSRLFVLPGILACTPDLRNMSFSDTGISNNCRWTRVTRAYFLCDEDESSRLSRTMTAIRQTLLNASNTQPTMSPLPNIVEFVLSICLRLLPFVLLVVTCYVWAGLDQRMCLIIHVTRQRRRNISNAAVLRIETVTLLWSHEAWLMSSGKNKLE